jgi:hypothetical protein
MPHSLKAIGSDHSRQYFRQKYKTESTLMKTDLLEKTPFWEKATSLGRWIHPDENQVSKNKAKTHRCARKTSYSERLKHS